MCLQIFECRSDLSKAAVFGGGDLVTGEEVFTENFARLELCALSVRAVGGNTDSLQRIDKAETEGYFRTHNDETNVIVLRELDDAIDIFDTNVVAIDFGRHPTVAWSGDDPIGERAF